MSIRELFISCYKVLPLVYDNSLSYYEVLCKVVDKINSLIKSNNAIVEHLGVDLVTESFDNEQDVKAFMVKGNIGKSFVYKGNNTNVLQKNKTYKVISNTLKTGDIISNERVSITANASGMTKEEVLVSINHNGTNSSLSSSHDGSAYGYLQGTGEYFSNIYDVPSETINANISGCVVKSSDDTNRVLAFYLDRRVYADKNTVTLVEL